MKWRTINKSPLALVAVLALVVFIFSGAVFAHVAMDQKVVESSATVQPKVEADSTDDASATAPVVAPRQSEPCTKHVSETHTNSGTNVSNTTTTNISCNEQLESGNTSVNVSNDSSQTAESGDSTGQSGSASNSDTTDINVSP